MEQDAYLKEENEAQPEKAEQAAPAPSYVFAAAQIPNPNAGGKKKHGGGLSVLMFFLGFFLASVIGVVLIVMLTAGSSAGTESGLVSAELLQKLQTVKYDLDQLYLFDQSEADTDTGMIKGYVDALGDPYTEYYTPDEYSELMEATSGTYSGIGVVVQQNADTGVITVVKPYENCPGAEAGMQANDILYEVEGEAVTGMDINLVVSKIKGESGTSVNITVYRPSTNEYLELSVTRRIVKVQTVSCEMLSDGIGKITIDSFDDVTYDQFVQCYEQLEAEGMEALIVDLRDNGGGLLDCVVNMLDYLLPEGTITYTEDKYGNRDTYTSDAAARLDIPCAVLTNGYTASASEIFTGCMKDYGKAVIVGTTTFGKGIVQVILPMNDGSALKVTTAYYYTPAGICIHGEGIEPDYPVAYDYESGTDDQLDKAVELMQAALGRSE